MAIRNMTYKNLMAVIHKIEGKGYSFEEAERMARGIFAEHDACPGGLSIEQRIDRILTYEEWTDQNKQ